MGKPQEQSSTVDSGAVLETDFVRELDRAVAAVRADPKWQAAYMRLIERHKEKTRLGERIIRVTQARYSRNRVDSETLSGILMIHPKTRLGRRGSRGAYRF